MLLLVGLLLRVLAFGTQVAPANGLTFNFTDVQQCDPVIISFAGSNTTFGAPQSLSIIPANSSAIVVPLPNPETISSGIALTFLPFPAGTNFVATLDDETGENVISVSDLIRVLPSPSGNSSCVAPPAVQRNFRLTSSVSQCEPITVSYNISSVLDAPIVRIYQRKGRSILLDMILNDKSTGTATYMMNFSRGSDIILLFDDGRGIRETTPVLAVAGDASSDKSCLTKNIGNKNGANAGDDLLDDDDDNGATRVSTRAIIIGSAAGGSAVVVIALCMAIFVVRDRRKRRKTRGVAFDPSRMEKAPPNEKTIPSNTQFPGQALPASGMVTNPIYTTSPFSSPKRARGSMASWAQAIPEDQRFPSPPSSPPSRIVVESPRRTSNLSLESLDIEGMLNMATLQSENLSSRKNSAATILGPSIPAPIARPPSQTRLQPQTSRRHLRDPSDVPAGPDSMNFSAYSINPFDESRSSVASSTMQAPRYANTTIKAPVGLPASPRSGRSPRGSRVNSTTSGRSSSDWYGIAQ